MFYKLFRWLNRDPIQKAIQKWFYQYKNCPSSQEIYNIFERYPELKQIYQIIHEESINIPGFSGVSVIQCIFQYKTFYFRILLVDCDYRTYGVGRLREVVKQTIKKGKKEVVFWAEV